jgi:hypothetical protein
VDRLSLRRRTVVYGPNYTYSAVAFHRSGVRFGAAFDTITFLPWFSVESFSVEGQTEFQRRIIATILARRGVFALAALKTTVGG